MNRSATIRQFAEEINVSEKIAYGMCRCEKFQELKIVFDIGPKDKPKIRHTWRIDIPRYYEARNSGQI
jgi:hypothetical protein